MDAIKLAIRNLQNEPKIRRASTTAYNVEDAVSQLSSTAILFELSSTSENTFSRLIELLRGRLLPLYRIALLLTLEYAVAIFRYIHQHKLLTSKHASESKRSWETVLESLFSGVLDCLEEDANSKHREAVGSALYAVLCPPFFCASGASPLDCDSNLLSTVYQLLMTTVEATPRNAMKLRDPHLIGSKRLGLTIFQTKEFLALESLLELFALLIPPLKGGRQKRTLFIKEVFDPTIFTCSDRIIRILEEIANPDWSITSAEIMKALAESDIMFPQPFEISRLRLDSMHIDTSVFYIDKSKFVANVDKQGKIETLHIPFSTISKISSASVLSNNEFLITAGVTKPPVLGNKPISSVKATGTELAISWQIVHKSLERFKKALKHRNLVKHLDIHPRRKQSKTEEISLDFQFEKQDSLALRRDKVQSLSQLWADKTPQSTHSSRAYSIPLVLLDSNSKQKPNVQTEIQTTEPGQELKPGTTVFISNGELTFELNHARQETRSKEPQSNSEGSEQHPQTLKHATLHNDSSEEEVPQPRSKLTNNRRRFISLPDDDDDAGVIGPATSKDTVNPESMDKTVATSPAIEKSAPPRPTEPLQLDGLIESRQSVKQPDKDQVAGQNLKNDDKYIDLNHAKGPRKRTYDAVADESSTGNRNVARHAKSLRLETQKLPVVPSRAYQDARKEQIPKTSSPLLKELDFDEIPRTTKDPKRTQMKGKNGKAAATNKRAPAKKVDKPVHKKQGRDVSKPPISRQAIEIDPDITLVDSKDKTSNSKSVIEDPEEMSNRRSARVATIQTSKKLEQKQATVPKKPKKAPWEEKDFLQKNNPPSDALAGDTGQNPKPSSETRDRRRILPIVQRKNIQPTVETGSSDNADQSACAESFHDYIVPTKLGSMSSDSPVPETKPEAIMIDLTADISPQKPRSRNASSIENLKKLPIDKHDPPKKIALDPRSTNDSSKARPDIDLRPKAALVKKPKENRTATPAVSEQNVVEPASQSESDSSDSDVALSAAGFVPEEASPFPRLRIPVPSRVKIEKMEFYPEILRGIDIQRSPTSKLRDAKFLNPGIKQMKSFDSVTDDTDAHYRRSSVKFDLPNTGNHSRPRAHNVKQDRARNRNRTPEMDDFSRGKGQDANPFSPFRTKTDPRSNKSTFEPAVQPMDKIIDILDKLNEGLIDKVARRFEGVSTELHVGQQMMFENAARDLKEISNASIHHFNDLVDLEAEYTAQSTTVANGVHDFRKCSEQLNKCYKNIVLEHNSRSLCRKFPKTLFPRVPEVISNPGIRR